MEKRTSDEVAVDAAYAKVRNTSLERRENQSNSRSCPGTNVSGQRHVSRVTCLYLPWAMHITSASHTSSECTRWSQRLSLGTAIEEWLEDPLLNLVARWRWRSKIWFRDSR